MLYLKSDEHFLQQLLGQVLKFLKILIIEFHSPHKVRRVQLVLLILLLIRIIRGFLLSELDVLVIGVGTEVD
jgi:hypothetical protein